MAAKFKNTTEGPILVAVPGAEPVALESKKQYTAKSDLEEEALRANPDVEEVKK